MMTIGRHFEMTTMVILVVILWSLIIWRPWSSFQNHDHQRGHGHLFGRIPFGQVCFFLPFFKVSNAPTQSCRQTLGQLGFLPLLVAVKDQKRARALRGNFLLVWVGDVFCLSPPPALILGMFQHKTLKICPY